MKIQRAGWVAFWLTFVVAAGTAASGAAAPAAETHRVLLVPGSGVADSYGYSMSVDGSRLVVGMTGDTPQRATPGVIRVFDRTDSLHWEETLLEPQGGAESRALSYAVGVSGDRIVGGGPFEEHIYLFERDESGDWTETILESPDSKHGDYFGHAVAIDGDRIVVGAPLYDSNGENTGAAFVFEFDGTDWASTKLLPSTASPRDEFGWSVAVAGDLVVVGQPHRFCCDTVDTEAVYVFEPDGSGGWTETKLVSSDHASGDSFGLAVATDGEIVVVGAPRAKAAYVFERATGWSEHKLSPVGATSSWEVGFAVDVVDARIAVGAPHRYDHSMAATAHLFEQEQGVWVETVFTDPDYGAIARAPMRWFGHSVGLSADFLAVGAPHDDTMDWDAGAIYEFSDLLPPALTDIAGNVHEVNIEIIASRGITRGCNPPWNDMYCPNELVTRGQMAAFLDRALGLPATTADFFEDDDNSIFEPSINRLAAARITFGCSNPPAPHQFCPNRYMTRGEMAAFLVRSFGFSDGAGLDLFVDDDLSVFEDDIDRIGYAGVTLGCNPPAYDRFCPTDPVRRDAMASFLARAIAFGS